MANLKELGAHVWARLAAKETKRWASKPIETQEKVFQDLIKKAKDTAFGKDHDFANIRNMQDFQARVPVRDYEELRHYVDRVVAGEPDILWPGKPTYFAKTSGTTSGAKYIPLTKESVPYHVKSARNALFAHILNTGSTAFLNGKMIFLQGSPELESKNGISTGRLSGITAHFVPRYLLKNRMPSWEVNCIEDWETKVDAIVEETHQADMTVISGIPPWVQMYFERLMEKTGKTTMADVFPNFDLFITGGVSFEPYKARFAELFGRNIPILETYPASEGFFAYQDRKDSKDLLLLLDNAMFYEFIPADQYFEENPPRLTIGEVELGVNYALILNTNAGLWGYSIGDTIRFVSKSPYRIRVSGRIKHYISAFGEHVIGSEVEYAMELAVASHGGQVIEFTVAPQVRPKEGGLPYHEWLVEFDVLPKDVEGFSLALNAAMRIKNVYYADLVDGGILRPCVLRALAPESFIQYMKSQGKLGGQNKVPRLMNDRKIADILMGYLEA